MTKTKATKPSARLLNTLAEFDSVLVIAHDNPDPDAIASGWAILWLVKNRLGLQTRLIGGGGIVRAENREMIRLLKVPLELVDHVCVDHDTAAVLVDCDVSAVNHLLCNSAVRPVAVIDHHITSGSRASIPFRDVRTDAAASATIVASYLREQRMQPPPNLATGLLYAIRTETRGGESQHSKLDRNIVAWLTERANLQSLSEIEDAPLPRDYFSDLVLALQSTFVYDDSALCFLPQAQGAEIIGEVADLLVRCQEIKSVLCAAVVGDALLLSVRTQRQTGNATRLVRKLLSGIGQGGGHAHRAGGKIMLNDLPCGLDDLQDDLRTRWLAACSIGRQRGTRLIAKREIVKNL